MFSKRARAGTGLWFLFSIIRVVTLFERAARLLQLSFRLSHINCGNLDLRDVTFEIRVRPTRAERFLQHNLSFRLSHIDCGNLDLRVVTFEIRVRPTF